MFYAFNNYIGKFDIKLIINTSWYQTGGISVKWVQHEEHCKASEQLFKVPCIAQ